MTPPRCYLGSRNHTPALLGPPFDKAPACRTATPPPRSTRPRTPPQQTTTRMAIELQHEALKPRRFGITRASHGRTSHVRCFSRTPALDENTSHRYGTTRASKRHAPRGETDSTLTRSSATRPFESALANEEWVAPLSARCRALFAPTSRMSGNHPSLLPPGAWRATNRTCLLLYPFYRACFPYARRGASLNVLSTPTSAAPSAPSSDAGLRRRRRHRQRRRRAPRLA